MKLMQLKDPTEFFEDRVEKLSRKRSIEQEKISEFEIEYYREIFDKVFLCSSY
jgi:chaperonin cofactor prefoldin